jgi:hypothetical protein
VRATLLFHENTAKSERPLVCGICIIVCEHLRSIMELGTAQIIPNQIGSQHQTNSQDEPDSLRHCRCQSMFQMVSFEE